MGAFIRVGVFIRVNTVDMIIAVLTGRRGGGMFSADINLSAQAMASLSCIHGCFKACDMVKRLLGSTVRSLLIRSLAVQRSEKTN